MVNSEAVWSKGENWKIGAVQCVRRLADLAAISKSDTVLDIRCGVGGPAILLAGEYRCNVFGLNPSELQLNTALKKTSEAGLGNKISYINGVAENIPFVSESFSYVWTFNMFYHIAEKQGAINEFYRVLKQGGKLAFDDWLLTDKAEVEDIKKLQYHWVNPSWVTDKELIKIIESAGFEITKLKDYSDIGRGVLKKNFITVFERDFRPAIITIDKRGNQMADDFRAAVEHTINLYSQEKLCYLQLVAEKS